MSLLIKNAGLPEGGQADIYIENGVILHIRRAESGIEDYDARVSLADRIDASGLCVMPAFADMHTHLRTPGQTHKETLETGCAAAVRGGYTAVCAMANTDPVCSSSEQAQFIAGEANALGLCDVFQCVSLTDGFDGKSTRHLDSLSPGGAVRCVSEDGRGVADGAVFLEAVRKANAFGVLPLIHAEDARFSHVDTAAAEDLETLRDLYLIEKYGCAAHFCHVSTRASAQAILDAKQRGAAVTFEVTPHHLALNESVDFRVNPPLRPEADRRFLLDITAAGLTDVIATDHAPHTESDKRAGAPGLVGLETAFPVCYTVLCVQMGMPLTALISMMSANPRRLLGMPEARLGEGFPADLVLADLNVRHTVGASGFASLGRNTPFDGMTYQGAVCAAIKGGNVVYIDDK
ncbi:MAG: dihydroorotase [Oscillospiraceae bacterium]|nr:dihydroorotase [Oscillospiraceae bacterium]